MAQAKRTAATELGELQAGNQAWWTANPMAYDWHGELVAQEGSRAWFADIDARFIEGARLFAHGAQPFDRVIPFDAIRGKRVLEIGCGMGLHTELMRKAGADLTSIDISPRSVELTQRRLGLKQIKGDVRLCDAEHLPFDDATFDFVWSWGVIHHSSRTGRITREIARVLKPTGETRVMVYNREGMAAWVAFWRRHVAGLGFLKRSFDETLFCDTDGFMARYYTKDQFEDLFRTFFDDATIQIFGQDADVIPLPRQLRPLALRLASRDWVERRQAVSGGFLFLTARSPCSGR
jgi:SAM-dependent methyltransferase